MNLADLERCFEGIVPATIATASADGTPNVTHLSRVHRVDADHVAVSNQFFSETTRNLVENPRASLVLIDPVTFDAYKLAIVYERTEKRGPLFDRLHRDIEAIASLTGMTGVFKLRGADVYRVVELDRVQGG